MEQKPKDNVSNTYSLRSLSLNLEEGGAFAGLPDFFSKPNNLPNGEHAHKLPIPGSDGRESTKGALSLSILSINKADGQNKYPSHNFSTAALHGEHAHKAPILFSDGREPTKGSLSLSMLSINKADGQNCFTQNLFTAVLQNLIRALGACWPATIVILAAIPWLKYLGKEPFLGLAVFSLIWPIAEVFIVYQLLEERSQLHYIYVVRTTTFIALLITFYLAWDLPLWNILCISEGIQLATNIIGHHFLDPNSTLTVFAKFRSCMVRAIVYRLQINFPALMAIGSFYLNLNGLALPDSMHAAITGISYPILKSLFVLQNSAYRANLFGKKSAPWPALEIAIEAYLAYPPKLSILLSFPFNRYFLTTVLLSFVCRVMIRLTVVSAVRYSEKPGSEKQHPKLVQYLNPLAARIKNTVTFVEAGECVAAICAITSSLALAGGDIDLQLINKILVILAAEIGCNSLAMAEEYRNGWLIGSYSICVGPLPGIFVTRMFGIFLVTKYAIL